MSHRDDTPGWEHAEVDDEIRRIEDEADPIDAELADIERSRLADDAATDRTFRIVRKLEISAVVVGVLAYVITTNAC